MAEQEIWATLFITSDVVLNKLATVPDGAYSSDELPGLAVVIGRAPQVRNVPAVGCMLPQLGKIKNMLLYVPAVYR